MMMRAARKVHAGRRLLPSISVLCVNTGLKKKCLDGFRGILFNILKIYLSRNVFFSFVIDLHWQATTNKIAVTVSVVNATNRWPEFCFADIWKWVRGLASCVRLVPL